MLGWLEIVIHDFFYFLWNYPNLMTRGASLVG
jgi:hypothetical protein